MTDRSPAGALAAEAAMAGAEALFSTQLALIRLAGYPIAKGFWTVRPPHELHLLDLAGQFHTAQASLRLIRLGRAVPGPNGQDSQSYWIEQADTSWEQLQRAVRAQLDEGNEDA